VERRSDGTRAAGSWSEAKAHVEDSFASIAEMNGFAIYAGGGHSHAGAAHDARRECAGGAMRKLAGGGQAFFQAQSRKPPHVPPRDGGPERHPQGKHAMHAIRRSEIQDLRTGEPMGREVTLAGDKTGINFVFRRKTGKIPGPYFFSLENRK
jgi:hypothetical protein